ncbi:hypothetical protein [Dyella jiangningensis]
MHNDDVTDEGVRSIVTGRAADPMVDDVAPCGAMTGTMPDLSKAGLTLAEADRHIDDARRTIAAQADRVRRWKILGLDAKESEKFLHVMEETLAAFLVHRELILDEIKRARA